MVNLSEICGSYSVQGKDLVCSNRVAFALSSHYAVLTSYDGFLGTVCQCSTQNHRLELSIERPASIDECVVYGYVRKSGMWVRVFKKSFEQATQGIDFSNHDLKSLMTEIMYRSFPDTRLSYWEELPSVDDVLEKLFTYGPTIGTLERFMYNYTGSFSSEPREFYDGYISTVCEEGTLTIPFHRKTTSKDNFVLCVSDRVIKYDSISIQIIHICREVLNWFKEILYQ